MIPCFDCVGIGGIDPAQFAAAIAEPSGVGGRVEKGPQRLDLLDRTRLQFLETDGLAAIAGDIPNPQDGNAGERASLDFEMVPVQAHDCETERFAPSPQPGDRIFDGLRHPGRQPGTEGKHAAGIWPVPCKLEIAFNLGILARPCPGDNDLGFGAKKKLGAVELRAQRHKLKMMGRLPFHAAPPLGEIEDRGEPRKNGETGNQRQFRRAGIAAQISCHARLTGRLAQHWRCRQEARKPKSGA